MQAYDIAMILVLVGATLFGAWKGLAWQLASIASMVLSYFAALYFRDALAPHIPADPPWNSLISMLVIFLLTSATIWILFRFVAGAIDRVKLKEFDRQIGALFGAAKGVLLCVVITFFALTLWDGGREHILDSHSGYYIAWLIDQADAVMPAEVHDVLGPYMHKIEKDLDPESREDEDPDAYHGREDGAAIEAVTPDENEALQSGAAGSSQAANVDPSTPSGSDQTVAEKTSAERRSID